MKCENPCCIIKLCENVWLNSYCILVLKVWIPSSLESDLKRKQFPNQIRLHRRLGGGITMVKGLGLWGSRLRSQTCQSQFTAHSSKLSTTDSWQLCLQVSSCLWETEQEEVKMMCWHMHSLQGDPQCLRGIWNTKCISQHQESSSKTKFCF